MDTNYRVGRKVEYQNNVYVIKAIEGNNLVVTRVGSSVRMTIPKDMSRLLIAESRFDAGKGTQSLRG